MEAHLFQDQASGPYMSHTCPHLTLTTSIHVYGLPIHMYGQCLRTSNTRIVGPTVALCNRVDRSLKCRTARTAGRIGRAVNVCRAWSASGDVSGSSHRCKPLDTDFCKPLDADGRA